jgi:uncharacterized surface protein with fasciclin (FAS1) repeats
MLFLLIFCYKNKLFIKHKLKLGLNYTNFHILFRVFNNTLNILSTIVSFLYATKKNKMKNLMKFPAYVLLAFLSLAVVSCDDDDEVAPAPGNSAYDLTKNTPDFSSLAAAIERADLVSVLDGAGTFTVFAPTNAAFAEFLSDNDFADLEAVPVPLLRATLLYHVLGSEVRSTGLTQTYVKTASTNAGGFAYDAFITLGTEVFINDTEIDLTRVDLDVDNGVVHVIDEVLTLPTIADLAVYNPALSSLVAALSQEGLVDIVDNEDATLTVFAPLNSSFDALIIEDPLGAGWSTIGDILALGDGDTSATSTLDGVLTYHVLATGAVRAADITDGIAPTTAQGTTFTINTTGEVTITDANGRVIPVLVTDITAINGVVHAIGNVLLP